MLLQHITNSLLIRTAPLLQLTQSVQSFPIQAGVLPLRAGIAIQCRVITGACCSTAAATQSRVICVLIATIRRAATAIQRRVITDTSCCSIQCRVIAGMSCHAAAAIQGQVLVHVSYRNVNATRFRVITYASSHAAAADTECRIILDTSCHAAVATRVETSMMRAAVLPCRYSAEISLIRAAVLLLWHNQVFTYTGCRTAMATPCQVITHNICRTADAT